MIADTHFKPGDYSAWVIEAFEASSNTVRGLVLGIREQKLDGQVEARLSPAARAAFLEPTAKRWWPGSLHSELAQACIHASSEEHYEEICFQLAKKTFGPIVEPMVKVTLAIAGLTPGSLLKQLGLITSVAIRGPSFVWTPHGNSEGTLKITYLGPTEPLHTLLTWRATLRYSFELTRPGTVRKAAAENADQTFVFEVAW